MQCILRDVLIRVRLDGFCVYPFSTHWKTNETFNHHNGSEWDLGYGMVQRSPPAMVCSLPMHCQRAAGAPNLEAQEAFL